jgi:hypothetical protein
MKNPCIRSILASHHPAVQILSVQKLITRLFALVCHLTLVDLLIVAPNVQSTLIVRQIWLVLE